MIICKTKMAALALAMNMVISGAAMAAADQGQGKVNFEGAIINSPCSITPDSVSQVVDLGQVSNAALKKGGATAKQEFHIKLVNCTFEPEINGHLDASSSFQKSVEVTFTGNAAVGNTKLLGLDGDAKGAGIALFDSASQLELGQPSGNHLFSPGGQEDMTMVFYAQLQSLGATVPIVPGEFTSVANFKLNYQ